MMTVFPGAHNVLNSRSLMSVAASLGSDTIHANVLRIISYIICSYLIMKIALFHLYIDCITIQNVQNKIHNITYCSYYYMDKGILINGKRDESTQQQSETIHGLNRVQ